MLRNEMKEPKNVIGILFVAAALLAAIAWLVYCLPDSVLYAAAGLYFIGMVFIAVFPDSDKRTEKNNFVQEEAKREP